MTQGSSDLHFFYDAQGRPAMVRFGGTDYFYVYDLQGDVVAMVDTDGTQVVEYMYDAWGAPISKTGSLASTLGSLNPFRYRGYVYDEETGLYYLRTRYYNPLWKRFINADTLIGYGTNVLGHNLFVYCDNLPIIRVDGNGKWPSYSLLLNYGLYKPFYSILAAAFLSVAKLPVTNDLFQHSIWGNGKDYSTNKKGTRKLSQAIAENNEMRVFLDDVATGMQPNTQKSISGVFEYTQGDLYYALQHVSYSGVISKDSSGKWSAALTFVDDFDFDAERLNWDSASGFVESLSLGNVANDGGLALQNLRILEPFHIVVDVHIHE